MFKVVGIICNQHGRVLATYIIFPPPLPAGPSSGASFLSLVHHLFISIHAKMFGGGNMGIAIDLAHPVARFM